MDIFRKIVIQGTICRQLFYVNIASQLNIRNDNIVDMNCSAYNEIKQNVMMILNRKSLSKSKKPIPMTLLYIQEIDMAPYEEIRTLMNMSYEEGSKLIVVGTGANICSIPELRLYVDPTIFF